MNSNIAQLITVPLDKEILRKEWSSLVYDSEVKWDWRTYIEQTDLPTFFKELIANISDSIRIKPKNCLFQVYDPILYSEKWYLNIVHKDDDRSTCITVPVILDHMEPVMFYEEIEGIDFKDYKKANKVWPEKPQQICRYSDKHPNLVNVNKLHNVRVLDLSKPRVLFQLSFDETFEEIINRNPDIWRLT